MVNPFVQEALRYFYVSHCIVFVHLWPRFFFCKKSCNTLLTLFEGLFLLSVPLFGACEITHL